MPNLLSRLSSVFSDAADTGDPHHIAETGQPRTIALPPELVPVALTSPQEAHRVLVETVSKQYGPGVEFGKDVRLTFPLDALLEIPHDSIWSAHPASTIHESTEELIVALRDLSHGEIFNSHYGPVDPGAYNMAGYLRCTRIRILRLFEALREMGIRSGTLLEVGSLYGTFALALQRLGFQVTAIDRYDSYGPGFRPARDLMQSAGVQVVSTTREEETQAIAGLGQYDVVIAMAVIEHIPHTPRQFLEQLVRQVKPGGGIALDTPNLVRYWNRVKFGSGESIFMDIKSQFYADLPYEGHHREYTGRELAWMLEQIGCTETEIEYFDYNLFQFEQIHRPHIECLLRFVEDPTCADTILVRGRTPGP